MAEPGLGPEALPAAARPPEQWEDRRLRGIPKASLTPRLPRAGHAPPQGRVEHRPPEAHLDSEKQRATLISLFALETGRLSVQPGI